VRRDGLDWVVRPELGFFGKMRNAVKRYFLDLFDRLTDRAIPRTLHHIQWALRQRGDSFHILDMAFLEAARDSADYWVKHMITAQAFDDDIALLKHATGLVRKHGLFLEFGVASGRTISAIANLSKARVFGFDSFEGLPEDWRTGFPRGIFASPLPKVPANVSLIKGLFSETLPGFLREHSEPVAFLHVDCDIYESAKCIFELLYERIGPGCVIVFDEYFNYPGWRDHEHRAFAEFVSQRQLAFRYDSFVPSHQQVCILVQ